MQPQNSSLQVPEQFSSIFGMGPVLGVFPVGPANRWVSAFSGVIFLGAAGLAVVYGFYDTFIQAAKYGPVMFGKTIITPMIIAAILLLIGILLVANAIQNWNKFAVAYDKGLAYKDNAGIQTWTWMEIEWLFFSITKHYHNGIYSGTSYIYTIIKTDGSKIILNDKFKKVEALGNLIIQKVFPYQYEKIIQRLRNGTTVTLGQISLNNDSITMNKKTYSWDVVETVALNKGFVSIKKKDGGWFSGATLPVSSIPNLDALLAVVNQIVKIKTG